MMSNKVIHRNVPSDGKPVEYHVLGLEDSEFFDSLVSFFKKYYDAEVTTNTDGISTRSWQLRSKGEYFMLEHHEDIGNWFYSCEPSGDSQLMAEIASDLEERLKDAPYES
jgi:hypothetical protein